MGYEEKSMRPDTWPGCRTSMLIRISRILVIVFVLIFRGETGSVVRQSVLLDFLIRETGTV